jgi:hypothetical protein
VDILLKLRTTLLGIDQATKKWQNRGAGSLTLRRAKGEEGRQPYYVFTTDSGEQPAGQGRGRQAALLCVHHRLR